MDGEKAYRYTAFISYKHADSEIAKKLQRKLETYRLPTAIKKEKASIKHPLYPICRDSTDFSPNHELSDEIRAKLDDSKFLIVICSENLIRLDPHWVEMEIQYFIDTGRKDKIIAVIASGIPGDKDRECFPQIFKNNDQEPLAVDLTKDGINRGVIRVISKILDLSFTVLWDREKRRARLQRIVVSTISAITLISILKIVWYNMPHVAYYQDYIERMGIPEGVTQLSQSDLKHLSCHYAITTQRGRVTELRLENSAHKIMDQFVNRPGDVCAHMLFSYTDDGSITVEYRDSYDVTYSVYHFSADRKYVSVSKNHENSEAIAAGDILEFLHQDTLTASVSPEKARRTITKYVQIYDDSGLLKERLFAYGDYFSETCDNNGVWGIYYTRDSIGRITREDYLSYDKDNHTYSIGVQTKNGAARTFLYDKDGHIQTITWLDNFGNQTYNSDWFSRMEYTYDNYGNIEKVSHFSPDGSPAIISSGYSIMKLSFDKHGFMTDRYFYGADGYPLNILEYYHHIYYINDKSGQPIEAGFYDSNDNKTYCKDGWAIQKNKYDHNHRLRSIQYFDKNYDPVVSDTNNAAGWEKEFDKSGRVTRFVLLGLNGDIAIGKQGYGILEQEYEGNTFTQRLYGFNSHLHKTIQASYDKAGNPERIIYNDWIEDQHYCMINNFDDEGNQKSFYFTDLNGIPIERSGYYKCECEYDAFGNIIMASYYDMNSQLTNNILGYARMSAVRNYRGDIIEGAYYNNAGELTVGDKGTAIQFNMYDSLGRIVGECYYGIDETPCLCNKKYSSCVITYNEFGQYSNVRYFGTDNTPCLIDEGYHCVDYIYDSFHRLYEEWHYDENDHPIRKENGGHGKILIYGPQNRVCQIIFCGIFKSPVAVFGVAPEGYEDGVMNIFIDYDEYGPKSMYLSDTMPIDQGDYARVISTLKSSAASIICELDIERGHLIYGYGLMGGPPNEPLLLLVCSDGSQWPIMTKRIKSMYASEDTENYIYRELDTDIEAQKYFILDLDE